MVGPALKVSGKLIVKVIYGSDLAYMPLPAVTTVPYFIVIVWERLTEEV